jgi:hypothetical protein
MRGATTGPASARRTILLVALAALAAVGSFAAGAAPVAASTPAARVTVIGDSVAGVLTYVKEARQYLGRGLDLRLDLRVCRRLVADSCWYMGEQPSTALAVVQAAAPGALGDILVVDVGYNDPPEEYGTDMEQFVQAVVAKGIHHLIWVTMREATDGYRSINGAIRVEAARWPLVRVADWNRASSGKDWFNPDGLHLNAGGALGLAKMLRPAVLTACGTACRSLLCPPATKLTRTKTGRLACLRQKPKKRPTT